jgi:hypothetical protein
MHPDGRTFGHPARHDEILRSHFLMKNFFSKLFSLIDGILRGATFKSKYDEFDALVEILERKKWFWRLHNSNTLGLVRAPKFIHLKLN